MRTLRILLIEDELLIALNAQDILEDEGHHMVGLAANAEQSSALALEHRPDLALVDLNLRDGLTGPEIGTKLAQEYGIPVLFVTANPSLAPLGRPGILGILPKPYAATSLALALRFLASTPTEDWASPPTHLWLTRLADPERPDEGLA
jgi:CheY-like chemotaxis protein